MKKLVEYYDSYDDYASLEIYLLGDDPLKNYEEDDAIYLLALTKIDGEYDSKIFYANLSAIRRLKKAFNDAMKEDISFMECDPSYFYEAIQKMVDGAEYGLIPCHYSKDGEVCLPEDQEHLDEEELSALKSGVMWGKIKDADNEKI